MLIQLCEIELRTLAHVALIFIEIYGATASLFVYIHKIYRYIILCTYSLTLISINEQENENKNRHG